MMRFGDGQGFATCEGEGYGSADGGLDGYPGFHGSGSGGNFDNGAGMEYCVGYGYGYADGAGDMSHKGNGFGKADGSGRRFISTGGHGIG